MHITFISSFVPRKCGIATYTKDLTQEIQKQGDDVSVIAMEHPRLPSTYDPPVTRTIRQGQREDYIQAAQEINASDTDIVHIQHEFGLYGDDDGADILELASRLTKPLVVTFHTILLTPTPSQIAIMQELARLSRRITVMKDIAQDRLEQVYGLSLQDISVIPHGAPIIAINQKNAKKSIGYPQQFLLLVNNLLSRNKGIEYAIEAVGKALPHIPNILFLIVGETHPLVKNGEGESYREELQALVTKLNLEKHVTFQNKYVSLEELKTLYAAADVYITPYLDPQQITSGTLSYAIGADKACISTPYIYATEMLAGGRGILVPFRDADAISHALITLFTQPEKRRDMEKKTMRIRKNMSWSQVASQHLEVYTAVLTKQQTISAITREFLDSPLDISYLAHLTDSVGIIQHAIYTIPDRRYGYSTDDNARALIVATQMYEQHPSPEILLLLKTYISFLHFAQGSDAKYHTFLGYHRQWQDPEAITDAYGKTMWALGFYLNTHTHHQYVAPVRSLFLTSLHHGETIQDVRNIMYTILGLYYYILANKRKTDIATHAMAQLETLANVLVEAFTTKQDTTWVWFENTITYDNFRLPQALFAAYLITQQKRYLDVAVTTLDFITSCNFDTEQGHFDFIGQNGWHQKGSKKAEYDQQPLEAAGAVECYLFAAQARSDERYLKQAMLAFEWFFGRNRNHRSLYDPLSKGVYDGLNLRGINQNEGAESIVCFLMAALSLKNALEERED